MRRSVAAIVGGLLVASAAGCGAAKADRAAVPANPLAPPDRGAAQASESGGGPAPIEVSALGSPRAYANAR